MTLKCDYCKSETENSIEMTKFKGSAMMYDTKDTFYLCPNCTYFISDLIRKGRKPTENEIPEGYE